MKTPEEIKIALEHCANGADAEGCRVCTFFDDCAHGMMDAVKYIEQLEEQVYLMKLQMRGDCGVCKHRSCCQINGRDINMSKTCYDCMMKETRPNWEYEGLPEVKSR